MFLAATLYVLLSFFDAWFTIKRLPAIGIDSELNLFARWMAHKYGVLVGIMTSVLIPTAGVVFICVHWLWLMTFMLGARATLLAFQLRVLFDPRTKEIFRRSNGPTEGISLLWDAHVLRTLEKRNRS